MNTLHNSRYSIQKFFLILIFFTAFLFNPHLARAQNQGFFTFGNNAFGKGGWFELGGEVEAEMVAAEKDTKNAFDSVAATPPVTAGDGVFHNTSGSTRFRFDKIMLKPRIYYPNKKKNKFFLQAELEFLALGLDGGASDSAFAKELFFNFNLSKTFFLKVGLDDRFFAPLGDPDHRRTEIYPINGTSFWKDEDWQIQLGADFTHLYFRAAVSNGLTLNDMPVGKDATYQIIHDDRATDDLSDSTKEIAGGVGLRVGKKFQWDLLGFGAHSRLSTDENQFLEDVFSGAGNRDNWLAGVNVNVDFPIKSLDVNLFSQWVHSRDGKMKRNGFYLQPSVTSNRKGKESLSSFELLYRWNWIDVEPSRSVDNITNRPMSWNRITHTVALNIEIYKGLKLRNEVHINEENGVDGVENNEILSQLEWRF